MRIYLAAPWLDRFDMDYRASHFEAWGFEITHKWWKYEGADERAESEEFLRDCAVQDVNGVATADYLVVFNTAKSEGKATEQGIAIALKVPIILIEGDNVSHNVFHRLPCYTKVKSIDEALDVLEAKSE